MSTNATTRGIGFASGLLAFLAAHEIEVLLWARWFGGLHDPWFLNSGRGVTFTMASLFGASMIGGGLRLSGLTMAAGAATAMTAVLMWGGGGTIFPIVLAVGAVLILMSTLLGAWIGKEIGNLIRTRR